MIKSVTADGRSEYELIDSLRARSGETDRKVTAAVDEIIENVKKHGDEAVAAYTAKFDGVIEAAPQCLDKRQIANAAEGCDPNVYESLRAAARNIEDFHKRQVHQSWMTTEKNGVITGQRIRGLARVGIYVPGGTASYPSSVLMNAIPARIAGVGEIVMVTPPSAGGVNPAVMAAAEISGVDKIFLCGGAQAVAALAFGTETIPKADKIVGPGNIYVATAKRQLFGVVDIDMVAGPSEILIIADETANPKWLAADMLGQSEHDMLASSILLTTSERVAEETMEALRVQCETLPRRDITVRSLSDYGAVIRCRSMDEAVELANLLAPEHLEVVCQSPMDYLGRLDNAGSVFLGGYSPESLGDYIAGPNHVLPTGGTARFFSPLSVDSFTKKSSFIYYTRSALGEVCGDIAAIARAEGLEAHARSAEIRFSGE